MRELFGEWYELDQSEIATTVKTGTIVLDTNVLLNLYRLNETTRRDVLRVLNTAADRLWMPYQVADEFQRNRLKVVSDLSKQYGELRATAEKQFAEIEKSIRHFRDDTIKDDLSKAAAHALRKFTRKIAQLESTHAISLKTARSDDPVRKALDDLFSLKNIGPRPTDEALTGLKKVASERIDSRIPPGFKDADKKDDPSGDYIIWAEMLDHKESSGRPLLFITNDSTGEDWYHRISGQTTGPLQALRAEMAEVSEHPYHQIPLFGFLELANEHLDSKVDRKTIDLVEQVSASSVPRELSVDLLSAAHANALDFALLRDQAAASGLMGEAAKKAGDISLSDAVIAGRAATLGPSMTSFADALKSGQLTASGISALGSLISAQSYADLVQGGVEPGVLSGMAAAYNASRFGKGIDRATQARPDSDGDSDLVSSDDI